MYTLTRHRRATRWSRRLVLALVLLIVVAAGWRGYRAWQASRRPGPQVRGYFA